MSWDKLSMADRAKYIALGVQNGITSLDNIRDAYNSYAEGGLVNKYDGTSEDTQQMDNGVKFDTLTKAFILANMPDKAPKYVMDSNGTVKPFSELPDLYPIALNRNSGFMTASVPVAEEITVTPNGTYRGNNVPEVGTTGQPMIISPDLSSISTANELTKRQADRYIENEYTAGKMLGEMFRPMNALSPSQQFGAIVDYAQGEKGYWEGLMQGNSGFFTDKFAEEHPYWTLAGNIGGDIAAGLLGLDVIEFAANSNKASTLPYKLYHSLGKHPMQRWDMLNQGNKLFERGLISRDDLYRIPSIKIRSKSPAYKIGYNGATNTMTLPKGYRAKIDKGFSIGHELGHFTETENNIYEFANSPIFSKKYQYIEGQDLLDEYWGIPQNYIEQRADWLGSLAGEISQKQALGTENLSELSGFTKRVIKNPHLFKKSYFHLDYGNNKGAFGEGPYTIGDRLFPGKTKAAGQKDYIWFNEGTPYSMGVNKKPFTRMIVTDAEDIPDLLHVRSQDYPIGQSPGKTSNKRSFVLPSEYVTEGPIDLTKVLTFNFGK